MRKAFCCSTVYICPQRKLSGASWPAEGLFHRGRGGYLVHAVTGSHSRVWASLYVCVCLLSYYVSNCVRVCGAQSL